MLQQRLIVGLCSIFHDLWVKQTMKVPFTRVVTCSDVDFYGRLHAATVVAGSLGGEVYFAETEGGRIAGVAVWFGPGREMFDS